jgi:hypothetical protein
MKFLNKLINAAVFITLLIYFVECRDNFWLAVPYFVIYTVLIIPTIYKNNPEYFSKFISYFHNLINKIFSKVNRNIFISRDLIKHAFFWGGIFYVIFVFTFLGSFKSFETCINKYGIKNISYCYINFERRQLSNNND